MITVRSGGSELMEGPRRDEKRGTVALGFWAPARSFAVSLTMLCETGVSCVVWVGLCVLDIQNGHS